MKITLKNVGLLALLLVSIAGIPLSIWWLIGEGGREPIVALIASIAAAGGAALGIDWGNLLITNVEHDRSIFKAGDELLREVVVREVVEEVVSGCRRRDGELKACDAFHFFCEEEGNAFLNKSLQKARTDFNAALHALGNYTAHNFFSVAQGTYKLYPELFQQMETGNIEARKRFDKHQKKLTKLSSKTFETYQAYRKLVKRRLTI
jgi:hypothetical protein